MKDSKDVAGWLLFFVSVLWWLPASGADDPHTGLWVGNAVVEKVNRPGKPGGSWDPDALLPASNPFTFRVLVHVSTNGQVRLLQRVLTVWNPKGEVVTNAITGQVTTNGYYVLLADESQVGPYLADQPDSKVYRISSANLPVMAPQILNGTFGGSGSLSGTVNLPFDDPVNPFVHRYAPLHDNRRVRGGDSVALSDGEESYTIGRDLIFQFAAADPDAPGNPRWGTSEVGGDFQETVTGLYQPIKAQGRFRLERLNRIGRLEP